MYVPLLFRLLNEMMTMKLVNGVCVGKSGVEILLESGRDV